MATISFARGAPSLDIVDVEGLREAAQLAFDKDPAGTTAYGTSVGYVPLREWIAEQHGVAVEQVLVTNGSMQADAFLFELLVQPGDAVIVESPTYDRTLLNLRNRGADVRMVDLEPDGISIEGLETVLSDGRAPEARAHHPELPEPGRLHALARRSASGCWSSRSSTTSRSSRTTRTSRSASRARRSRRCSPRTTRAAWSTPPRSPRPSARASASATWSARRRSSSRSRRSRTNTYISPNMVAQSIVNQFARSGRMDGAIDDGQERAARPPRRGRHRAPARDARGHVRPPRGRLLHVGRAARGASTWPSSRRPRPSARCCSSRARTSCSRAASNTLRLAYSGVTPGADRRGHHQARRGPPLPWRRSVIATATTPRSTACCTARGRSRSLIHGGFWKAEYDLTLMDALVRGPRGARLGGVEHRVPAARQRRRRAGHARRRERRDRPPGHARPWTSRGS